MASTFDSINDFVLCSATTKDKINRLEQVVDALINQSIASAGNSDVEEYMLNDGQVIIKEVYRNPEQLAKAIDRYMAIINRLKSQCSGTRIVRRQDSKSFNYLQRRYGN